jgi:hypothetical protein
MTCSDIIGRRTAYGKYKSVLEGATKVFALIACMAALKSPLYSSCFDTSAVCHVHSMASMFSGSESLLVISPSNLNDHTL